ncbi:hypothetical protein, variant 1 [Aphanomyces invadans]|uniref:Calcineurin-like phosphoesterase domain-containing protein n=1 Tax=Aphanomyces invadans TaxID=157072 RepID=A0A024UR59_9STRA|nr:hypothetical protein, variant 1 [Aphanomyces invadans]ETW08108.1 hypothetical protein, variant 1 [Aphanomyces invadans]|eukprot:XP_008864201.1 hypothetical protein, variant 1 [Aphanomyces invadans]
MARRDPDAYARTSSIGEDTILPVPEEVPASRPRGRNRVVLIGVIAAVLIAGGVTAAFVIGKGSSSSSNNSSSSDSSNTATPSQTSSGGGSSGNGTTISSTPTSVKSNPETDPVVMTMLAIGDWGSTTGRGSDGTNPGSCCVLYKSDPNKGKLDTSLPRSKVDFRAQEAVGILMGISAAALKPSRILSHGDNIYWNGVGMDDRDYRMAETFEKMYGAPSLENVPWLNVAGNHDIGGSAFICGDSDTTFRKCTSTAEMLKYLDAKFDLQAGYVSPRGDRYGASRDVLTLSSRWIMKGHYYVHRVTKNGVTVDIFNLDTNEATTHGAQQVCCQCFGYGGSDDECDNISPGSPLCAGGNVDMYKACMDRIQSWADVSYEGAKKDLAASTADFKIINTHYSPHYHMDPTRMKKWFDLTKQFNVHAWFNGHTHGFNHDITAWNTHFFQNGAGGGIVSESSGSVQNVAGIKSQWVASGHPYGFMELSFTKEWLKVEFVSFDNAWQFNGFASRDIVPGGVARGHCWFVHKSSDSPGLACESTKDGLVGLPT